MIVISCRAEPRPVDGSYCSSLSVFSEALDAPVTKLMFFASLRLSLFLDFTAPDCHVVASLRWSNFASSTAGRTKLRIFLLRYCVVNMVLIDRASRELSNGGHIVFWSNLDLIIENPAVGSVSRPLTAF